MILSREFFDAANLIVTSIVDQVVNPAIELERLLRDLLELLERRGNIEAQNISSSGFQILQLTETSSGGDDSVASR